MSPELLASLERHKAEMKAKNVEGLFDKVENDGVGLKVKRWQRNQNAEVE